jgi:hypothetical protein
MSHRSRWSPSSATSPHHYPNQAAAAYNPNPYVFVKTEPSYYRYSYTGCYTMLWDQTKQLPKELLKQVEDTYREHFSLEVRLQLALWIEEKFSPTTPFNVEDPAHQKMAVSLANQLMTQLDARIAAMPNDPDKFLMKGKLEEIAAQLKVRKELPF